MATRIRFVLSILVVIALLLLSGAAFARMGPGGGGGGMGGGGGGGGGGMDGGVIDPPPGAPFQDPPEAMNMSGMPGMVHVMLEVQQAQVNVNGTMANLLTYNGTAPGPTIRVHTGDMLGVHLMNSLPPTTETNLLGFTRNITNLHTHGLHVSPEEPADAAHLVIPPGGEYHYEYDLMAQEPGSMCFYHGHSHGVSAEQYWAGMVGALIVEDPPDSPLAAYETHLMILKDIALVGSEPAPHDNHMDYMHGLEGNTVMVNGQVNPVLSIRPGQVQRWRVLNASNARFYKLSLEGHSLYVVGTDGGLLDKPYQQSYVILAPGERVDLLVKASLTTRSYRLLSLPYAHQGNMTSAQITLLTMSDQDSRLTQSLPATVNPAAARLSMDTSMLTQRRFALSMGQGRAYINGHDFDVDPEMIMSELGTYEVWEIVNQSGMDHPWHQHVNAAQMLSVTGGDSASRTLYTTAPAWKDTILVPKWGSVRILVPVMDWPGMTMYHCHILEHEDIGMMGMWHIMGEMEPME